MHPQLASLTKSPYFDTYLAHLESADVIGELERSLQYFLRVVEPLTDEQLNHRYAPGKWSVKQVIQHVIDCEMIFNYRALTIGREEVSQHLQGFDENAYATQADVSKLSKQDLIALFRSVRASSIGLYKTFTEEQLHRVGIASGQQVEVLALFYIHSGHSLHHLKVIQERYLS